jgi:hypothetical protein
VYFNHHKNIKTIKMFKKLFSKKFCIDVTFEMRTVLYRIHLFIDNIKMSDRIFISNGDCRKRAGQRRDRERESVCVRGSTLQKRRDGIDHKLNS